MWWFRPVGEEEISSEIGRRPADEISVSEMRVKPNQPGRCHMIGLEAGEIEWVRLLVDLLRRGDPLTPELARQALEYVESIASTHAARTPLAMER